MTLLELLTCPIPSFVLSIIFFSVGYFIINALKIQLPNAFSSFIMLLLGAVVMAVFTGVYLTKGVTVLSLTCIPFFYLFYHLYKEEYLFNPAFKTSSFLNGLKIILLFNLIWSVIFLGTYSLYLLEADITRVFYPDCYYYAKVGDMISISGQENIFWAINLHPDFGKGTSTFHYFMTYQNVLHSMPFHINSVWTFLVSLPISFGTVSSLLIWGILKSLNPDSLLVKNTALLVSISVLLLFVAGFNILPFDYHEKTNFSLNIINHVSPKYHPIFWCIALTSYAIYQKKYVLAFMPLLFLPIFTFLMFPITLIALGASIFILALFKQINARTTVFLGSASALTILGIMIFYKTSNVPDFADALAVPYGKVFSAALSDPLLIIKRVVASNVYWVLDYLIYFLPFSVFIVLCRKSLSQFNGYWQIFFFIFILLQGAFLTTCMLYGHHEEAWQPLFFTSGIASLVLLIFMFSMALKIENKALHYTISLIIAGVCFINLYKTITAHYAFHKAADPIGNEFYQNTTKLFEKNPPKQIALLGGTRMIAEVYSKARMLYHIVPSTLLYYIDEQVILGHDHWNPTFYFYLYSKNKDYTTIDELQLEFMKEHQMNYFISDKPLPDDHKLIINSKLLFQDPVSKLYIRVLQ